MHNRVHFNRFEGKRMPDKTVLVTRITRYGNPFPVSEFGREEALRLYKQYYLPWILKWKMLDLAPLAGKDLACDCQQDEDCHADILIDELIKSMSHE